MTRVSWPTWVTLVRILLIAPFLVCLLNVQQWWAARWVGLAVFAVMAVSDALDGFLARRLDAHTVLGKFLDPVADKLLVLSAVVTLATESASVVGKIVPNWVVVAVVGKEVVVVLGFVLIYLATGRMCLQPRPSGKICTVLQFAMVVSILLWPNLPGPLRYLPDLLWWLVTALAAISAADYCIVGMRFAAATENGPQRGERT